MVFSGGLIDFNTALRSSKLDFKTPKYSDERLISKVKVNKDYFCSTLKFCSQWQNKNSPKSVLNSRQTLHKGKIYASLEAIYKNDSSKSLLVQEGNKFFGYYPHMFILEGLILFPPIESNEVWSIGFIQYGEANESFNNINYGKDLKFVFQAKIYFELNILNKFFIKY